MCLEFELETVLMFRSYAPLLALACFAVAGDSRGADLKSGIAVGELVKAFSPRHVTGPDAGKSSCLV